MKNILKYNINYTSKQILTLDIMILIGQDTILYLNIINFIRTK
jgi:hypothetical protein